jgi:molybdopterin-guanine dinucleotide biosynthesis protein A
MAMTFSAVILAGGRSSRMGRDKAFLEFRGESLLSRQISLALETGASEVFISGRPDVDYSAFKCPVLLDELSNLGPIAGIASALRTTNHPLLLVLAVDMPHLTASFLRQLLSECRDEMGAVPISGETVEPLAAFYPKSACGLVNQLVADARPSVIPGPREFAKCCVDSGLARFVMLQSDQSTLFKSLNSPADFSSRGHDSEV